MVDLCEELLAIVPRHLFDRPIRAVVIAGILAHHRFPECLRAGDIEQPIALGNGHQMLRAFVGPVGLVLLEFLRGRSAWFVERRSHREASRRDQAALADQVACLAGHLELDPEPESIAADGGSPFRTGDLPEREVSAIRTRTGTRGDARPVR